MKQVIPFKKDIIFKTKISDITSISLEHTLDLNDDIISGDFIISGDYKMTEASVNKEDFYYKLPFDIALDSRYDTSKLKIEINDFYYEIINSDVLRVNIEVLIDGLEEKEIYIEKNYEKIEDKNNEVESSILDIDIDEDNNDSIDNLVEQIDVLQEELIRNHKHVDKLDEKLNNEIEKEEEMTNNEPVEHQTIIQSPNVIVTPKEVEITNIQNNQNTQVQQAPSSNIDTKEIKSLFNNLSDEETFSTYHVYILRSDDTIESVMTKYNISKEILGQYNDIDNIKLGDKIIIPTLTND